MIRVWVANAVVLETFEKEVHLQSWVLIEKFAKRQLADLCYFITLIIPFYCIMGFNDLIK